MFMVSQSPEAATDHHELEQVCRASARIRRVMHGFRRSLGRFRFIFAPTIEQSLRMVEDLEKEFGGERAAAEVLGPSVITVRAWKRRRKMSVPSRRLVWLIWALTLHPEQVQSVDDLLTWGRLRQPG
jgi:hypothetical protein